MTIDAYEERAAERRAKHKRRERDRRLTYDGTLLTGQLGDDELLDVQLKIASIVVDDVRLYERRDQLSALRDVLDALGLDRRVGGWHADRGSIFGYWWHIGRGEPACGPCADAQRRKLDLVWER